MEFMVGLGLGLLIAGALVVLHHLVFADSESGQQPTETVTEQPFALPDPTRRRIIVHDEPAENGREKCPICGMPFESGRRGWDGHIGSPDACPTWHPEITDPAERRRLFQREFAHWLI